MRKIDKLCSLSTAYKQWEASLEKDTYPKYNSSNNKYYTDIVMQLLYCQDGLCAYTERRLCKEEVYDAILWSGGRYTNKKPDIEGELEHFDESKKAKKSAAYGIEDWSWDNFFLVSTHINQKVKGSKSVDYILKPDRPDYDENKLLAYNFDTHHFTANPNLTQQEQESVQIMLKTLGINYGSIVRGRQEYLNDKYKLFQLTTEEEINQFPTAYRMMKLLKESSTGDSILDSL